VAPCYSRRMWGSIELLLPQQSKSEIIDMIRTGALGAAGLVSAAVAGGSLLRRKR